VEVYDETEKIRYFVAKMACEANKK
jgi:hypothetical protein